MTAQPCDALVLFGVTGDLAGRMVLPALATLADSGALDMPLVGVARCGPDGPIAQRVLRNLDAIGVLAGVEATRLVERMRFVDGDLADPATFAEIRAAISAARRPLLYLAVPPSLFAVAAKLAAQAGLAAGARIAVEKPFGHDAASARELEAALESAFPREAILRIDHYLGKWPLHALARWRAANPWLEQAWSGAFVRSVQITMAESFGVETRGAFYDRVGALRDVVQNHVMQVVAALAMELPDRADAQSWQDARVTALEALQPVDDRHVVRGQYDGYRSIEGVAPDSTTETYVALRLALDTPRWRGVPFCIRAGKRLPATITQVYARYLPPAGSGRPSHIRIDLGPGDVALGVGIGAVPGAHELQSHELSAPLGRDDDREAYATLLDAALRGNPGYYERADGVAATWRALDPLLRSPPATIAYARGSWGPAEADRVLAEGEAWYSPTEMGSG